MSSTRSITATILCLALLTVPSAFAWGEKGHYIVNEAATWGTVPEMPSFFHDAYPSLVYLGYDPDRIRRGGDSIDPFNAPNHFLDHEYVEDLDTPPTEEEPKGGLPRSRWDYLALLQSSGTLRKYSISLSTPGFLPWQIAEVSEHMLVQWRLWRASRPGTDERRQIEQNLIYLAGTLGHFTGDAGQPLHATIHYNGWVGPNPQGWATDCETHGRFETEFVSQSLVLSDVVPRMPAPRLREDFFAAGMELIRDSKTQVPRLYEIDKSGGFSVRGGTAESREFAAGRMALGAALLRDLWWSTYVASASRRPSR